MFPKPDPLTNRPHRKDGSSIQFGLFRIIDMGHNEPGDKVKVVFVKRVSGSNLWGGGGGGGGG